MTTTLPREGDRDARHRRNLVYNHPTSKAHRAESLASHREASSDPIAMVRIRHREEAAALADKHRGEGDALQLKHTHQRREDRLIGNGAPPDAGWLHREARERRQLHERHAVERGKMAVRHQHEMTAALDRHGRAE